MNTLKNIVGLATGTVLIAATCVSYAAFVNQRILEESTDHLAEIYTQVNTSFTSMVSKNWSLLDDWGFFVNHLAVEHGDSSVILDDFLAEVQATWGFTDFYFIDRSGNYLTVSGSRGYLDLGSHLEDLMLKQRQVIVDGTLPTGDALTIFASPVQGGTYQGMPYNAIAISYNSTDMENVLNVSAFENLSECYVVYSDGRILASAGTDEARPYNYLAFLDEHAQIINKDLEDVSSDIAMGQTGMAHYRVNGEEYYLSYQPVGFENWSILGVVPTRTVNASMNQIQWVTVTVIALVFVCISVAGILLQRQHNRRRLDKKDAELRSREQLFGVLADNTNDIFVMFSLTRWNKRPKVEYVSPNIQRLIGIAAEDVRHNLSLLSQTAINPACNLLDESIRRIPLGETRHVSCERVHQSTGERRWFSETLYHLSLDNAEKYILVLSDRTEERQASDTLSEALAIAKSSNEAKSSFLAKMSHDIRTPINAITGMTRIAQENVDNAQKTADCLNVIAHSSQHLLGIINDVLDMSKIESGQMHLQEQTCTLDSILEDIDSIIAPQAQAKGQTLVYDTSRTPHRTCICDRLRLNQVLLNLLSNAVKYTPEGGTVRFTVEEIENMKDRFIKSRFIVADNGIGMPREFIERIFEPFERSDQESVSDIQGTGLGMPITKAIVDAMGGSISIESEVGKGSTFTVTLEMRVAADRPEPLGEEPEGSDEAYSFEGKLFLLAEDNDINALIMQELLDMEGAQAEWAENGQEAVRMFSEKPAGHYDVILMDVQMPVMDGYAATAAIRALPREDAATVPIVALTANAFAEDVHRALEAGMNAHVAKPVEMKDLGRTLAGL